MSPSKRCLVVSVLILLVGNAFAARLVRDINTLPLGNSTLLSHWTTIGTTTYFLAGDVRYGEELWRTDGTPAGTTLVKDINPGPADSGIMSMIAVGGALYFLAGDGTNGVELWRSDGTASGTRIVADIYAGSNDGVASSELIGVNGLVYFVGVDLAGGQELWRSDGTSTGTYRVADICAGACGSGPQHLVASGSRLFFSADDSKSGVELWTSDGTAAGTHRVADINQGSGGSEAWQMTATPAGVFFVAFDTAHGNELWFAPADGSKAQLVSDMTPGPQSSTISSMGTMGADVVFGAITIRNPSASQGSMVTEHKLYRANGNSTQELARDMPLSSGVATPESGFVPYGGRLLFGVSDQATSAWALWVTDGTAAGTHRLGGQAALVSTSLIGGAADLGGLIAADGFYFLAHTGPAGSDVDLWRTDGTEAGTIRYANLPQPFITTGLAQYQGRMFFAGGRFGTHGEELWSTDGTPAGTAEFADLSPGSEGSSPSTFIVAGSRLLFATGQQRPWVSDGTVAGTRSLLPDPVATTAGSDPQQITALANRAVFSATDNVHGTELWVSDGTSAGTILLKDILPGSGGSIPVVMGVAGSLAFFSATDATHGNELWATDGTPAGTYLVRDIRSGALPSNLGASSVAVLDGVIYFSADDGIHGPQLWRSDGTFVGTWAVKDLGVCVQDIHVISGRLVFQVCESTERFWWQSNGTVAGTSRVTSAVAVTSSTAVIMNGTLYFGGQATPFSTPDHGQLWRTDGTSAGTTQITNFDPAATYTLVEYLHSMPGHVLYQYCVNAATASCGIMSSDGTAAGTVGFSSDSMAGDTAVVGNRLVYTAIAPSGGLVLRGTDGTVAGTVNLLQVKPQGQFLGALASIQGHVLFTQVDSASGPSVWRTDGAAATTQLVADIDPGVETAFIPYGYKAVGGQVFFQGAEARWGAELYVMDAATPNASDDVASVTSSGSLTIPVSDNDGSISSGIDRTTVSIVTAPSGGTVSTGAGVGAIYYTANAGYSGSDQFTYTIADSAGHVSAPATVFVTVAQPAGSAPGAPPAASSPSPPSSPPASGGGGDEGGGGSLSGASIVFLGLLLMARVRRPSIRVPNPS